MPPILEIKLNNELDVLAARQRTRQLAVLCGFTPHEQTRLSTVVSELARRATDDDRRRLEKLAPAGSLRFHQGASDDEYARLLSTATALVTASRNEGFGLPLLEAMVSGTPVVVSDIPVFREIGLDAASYFDPDSPEQFASAVTALEDKNRWLELSRLSVERSETFRWDRSARILLDVLLRDGDAGKAR